MPLQPEYFSMVLARARVTTPNLAAELAVAAAQADELTTALRESAARHKIYLLACSIPMRVGGVLNNLAAFIAPSGALAFQDKQCMTRFDAERWGITGGNPPQVFETSCGRIGVSICYDSEFPLHLRTQGAVFNHRDWPEAIPPCPVVPLA
ncbi:MAG: hypothetical protein PHE40_01205 [Acidocella sp.]|nr:hypothetical protein [Acidocella sp.]